MNALTVSRRYAYQGNILDSNRICCTACQQMPHEADAGTIQTHLNVLSLYEESCLSCVERLADGFPKCQKI
jgi:hypothetical protein